MGKILLWAAAVALAVQAPSIWDIYSWSLMAGIPLGIYLGVRFLLMRERKRA